VTFLARASSLMRYGRSVTAAFTTALNDPAGRWSVKVADLASKKQAEAAFTVK